MTQPIEIRAATEATAELAAAFGRLIPQLSTATPPDLAALREIVASPSNTLLLAYDVASGKIVGTLTLVVCRIPTAIRAWIEDVVVDATARGRGVGEALTREGLRLAAERGAASVELTSRPAREAANRLYQRLGFVRRATNVYRYSITAADRPPA
jgi:ribosomal protein S18 acetylase RimI-like enzyme